MHADAVLRDRYRLSRLIASGGMGEVWQAHDVVLGRDVAVKMLVAGSSEPAALERFRREAVAMAALQHPNTVMVLDIGTHEAWTYIVMELLPGPTLAQLSASRGPLPEPEVARLGAQVAAGLAAAHRAGIVHRDIKPGNLMLGASGELKVVDFGVARLSQAAASALTATNTIVGSALYLSPEQAAGLPATERSDLYALGCVLMTLATGRPPFETEHPIGALHQHLRVDPPLLRTRRPAASEALETLIAELLAKDPDDRPASAAAVAARLRTIETSAPGPTAVIARPSRAAVAGVAASTALLTPVDAPPAAPRRAHAPARRAGRGRSPWVAAAVLASSSLLAAMALTQRGDPPPEAPAPPASISSSPTSAAPSPSASPSPSGGSPTPTDAASSTSAPRPQSDPAPQPAVTRDPGPPAAAIKDEPARGKSEEKKPTEAEEARDKAKGKPENPGG